MKKILIFAMILALVFTFTGMVSAENKSKSVLTVAEAQSIAAANNRQAAIDDLEIRAKETALKQAVENAATVASSYTFEGALNVRVTKYVKPMEAERALELAKMSKQKNARQLKQDIKDSFMKILLAQKELEAEIKKLEFSKSRLETTQARYVVGSTTQQDVDSAQYSYESKMNDVAGLEDRIKMLDVILKDQMGWPLDGDLLVLKGAIEPESVPEIDIEKVITDNIESDTDVYGAAGKLDAARKTMELTKELLKPGRLVYDDYLVDVEIALRDYETAKRNRERNIRNTYNDLLNLRDSIELAVKYEELQLKMLDSAKVKYEKGLMSKDEYTALEEKYLDAVFSKHKAICDYNIRNGEFLALANIE